MFFLQHEENSNKLEDEKNGGKNDADEDVVDNQEDFSTEEDSPTRSTNSLSSVSVNDAIVDSGVTLRRTCKLRRSKVKLRRRCSINGHYYNREVRIWFVKT